MRLDVGTFIFFLLLLAFCYFLKSILQKHAPALPISNKRPFSHVTTWRVYLSKGSDWLFWAAVFFLLIALSHPRKVEDLGSMSSVVKTELPRSGRAVYFLIDESGSMSAKVSAKSATGSRIQTPKITLGKQAIMEFIQGNKGLNLPDRKNDLIGLMAFARVPELLCPLTLNRQEIAQKVQAIEPMQTDDRNGSAIGYAIFKAVNIIVATKHFAQRQQQAHKSVYTITNQAIIIITDGLQSPHPDDKNNAFRYMSPDEATAFAKANGVRVFYIGIDPILADKSFASDVERLRKSMKATGGDLFLVTTTVPIEEILSKIDTMEKSELPPEVELQQTQEREVSLVYFFIMLAMTSLLLACILETTVVRSAP